VEGRLLLGGFKLNTLSILYNLSQQGLYKIYSLSLIELIVSEKKEWIASNLIQGKCSGILRLNLNVTDKLEFDDLE
jgi:hypothetical protein